MTAVKICGMRSARDLESCRRADLLGFVVSARSPRNLDLNVARTLMSSCDNLRAVVTTETDRTALKGLVSFLEPDVLQLHVPLDEGLLEFASGLGTKVWGMMPVASGAVIRRRLLEHCNALVLDTPGERAGGNGKVHDWSVSRELRDSVHPFPVVLAGGLRPENVADAIRNVTPYAVDVSSGVESGMVKDPEKVSRFIEAVKKVERS